MSVAAQVVKKFINDPETVVPEALAGVAAAHPGLVRVDLEKQLVLRADAPVAGKVGLVSGGQYTGQFAVAAYEETHDGATFIPVEQDGGSGTAGSHWDEQALINELMTGYINGDTSTTTVNDNYLSKFSVMSLADLGYKVTYSDYAYDGTPTIT